MFKIACLLTSNFLFAQYSISGNITDIENTDIDGANVLLYQNEKLVKYTFSTNGRYAFKDLPKNYYLLEVSSMQYKKSLKAIKLVNDTIVNFKLDFQINQIDEVVIDIERDIKIKGDTIIFKVDAFHKKKNVAVEQMLKSIPGISINSEGVITFQGKLVTNVKIDGDDLFDGGYTILTKNLNSDYIKDVEVLQNYSKNPLLKNIRDTEDIAINLTLKENKKKLLFGNVDTGYANKGRYDVNANLISFINKTKSYAFTDLNTIGDDVVSKINSVLTNKNDDKSYTIGKGNSAFKQQSLNTRRPIFDDRLVNFNKSNFFNFNTILNPSEAIKIKLNGILFNDTKNFQSQSITDFIIEDPFQLVENFNTDLNEKLGLVKVNATYSINIENRLEYNGTLYKLNSNGQSNLQQNSIDISEDLNSKTNYQSHFLHYTYKVKDSLALVASAKHINEKIPSNYLVTPYLYGSLFEFEDAMELQNSNFISNSKMKLNVIQLGFINNNKKSNIESYIGYKNRVDKVKSNIVFQDNDLVFEAPQRFTNNLTFKNNLFYLDNRYRKTFGKFNFYGQLEIDYSNFSSQDIQENKTNFFYLQTTFEFKYSLNNKNKFALGLSSNANSTNINNALSGFTQSFYRGFYRGLNDVSLLKSNTAYINYIYGNWSDKFTFNLNARYTKNKDFLTSNSSIRIDYNLTEQIILENSDNLRVNFGLDQYLDFMSSNFKLKSSLTYSNFSNIINDQFREVVSNRYNYGIEVRSAFNGFFNYTFGTEWDGSFFNINSTKFNNINNKSFLDLNFIFSNGLNISAINNLYTFGNLPKNDRIYFFTNIIGQYNFKNSKTSAFLRINNLFNTKSFNIFSISETVNSVSQTPLIERYFMLGLNFKF